jgi:hypothetical protein
MHLDAFCNTKRCQRQSKLKSKSKRCLTIEALGAEDSTTKLDMQCVHPSDGIIILTLSLLHTLLAPTNHQLAPEIKGLL